MKKIKDFEEFEKRLKNEHIAIPAENKKQIIHNLKTHSKPKTKRLSAVAVISMCLFLSVAAVGAMEFTGLTFFNKDSTSIIEVKTMTEEEMKPHLVADEVIRKNIHLMEKLKKTIPEGKFIYFLDVEAYEQSDVLDLHFLSKSPPVKDVEEIPRSFAENINMQNQLLQTYVLTSGLIHYKVPQISNEERLRITEKLTQQAKQLNRHYGVLEGGDLLQEVNSVYLHYEIPNSMSIESLVVNISSIGKGISTNEDYSSYIELESDLGGDVYYSEDQKTLLFVHYGERENYLVSIRNPVISEENIELQRFIDIAKVLINKQ